MTASHFVSDTAPNRSASGGLYQFEVFVLRHATPVGSMLECAALRKREASPPRPFYMLTPDGSRALRPVLNKASR